MPYLAMVRHGLSAWNQENRFTGWVDVDLAPVGIEQAQQAGDLLRAEAIEFDHAFTSVLRRAIRTLWIALDRMDRMWLPQTLSWRLNERHYGGLQGLDKKATAEKYGADQVLIWRRAYATPPLPMSAEAFAEQAEDPRYAHLPPDLLPATECLADVVDRMLPYWYDDIVPDLAAGRVALIAAHGNSLRAIVKHLFGVPDDRIVGVEIPTGNPLEVDLDADLKPTAARYLDADRAQPLPVIG